MKHLLLAVLVMGLSSACIKIYQPYPVPLAIPMKDNAVVASVGLPSSAEFQKKVSERVDIIAGAATIWGTDTETIDSVEIKRDWSETIFFVGPQVWISPRDHQGFGASLFGGASYTLDQRTDTSWKMAGFEIGTAPGLYYKNFSFAFPLRYGMGAAVEGSGEYHHFSLDLQLTFRGEHLGGGARFGVLAGMGDITGANGVMYGLFAVPENFSVYLFTAF